MANTNQPIKELLKVSSCPEWKDFLFNLQSTLIENGHVETLTESGRSDFAARIQGLYNFFGQLDQQKKQS